MAALCMQGSEVLVWQLGVNRKLDEVLLLQVEVLNHMLPGVALLRRMAP